VHELGHFVAAKISGVKVEEFGLGYPPRIVSINYKGTIYSLNLLPLGGFVRLLGEDGTEASESQQAFCNCPHYQQAGILLAGVTMNLVLGLVLLSLVFTLYGVPRVNLALRIDEIVPGSPASELDIHLEDEITGYAQFGNELQDISSVEEFQDFIKSNLGERVKFRVRPREDEGMGSEIVVDGQLRSEFVESEGALGIGFRAATFFAYEKIGLSQVPLEAIRQTWSLLRAISLNVGQLVLQLLKLNRVPEGVAGPVGIARITGRVAREGIGPLLHFAGILSISLAGFNILPFPALDGGRLVVVIIEAFSRRRINADLQRWVNALGMVFLLILMAWVTFWDVSRLF